MGLQVKEVKVYRANISAIYQRGGSGYRWLDGVRLSMHRACVRESLGFVRSGEISRSHRSFIRGLNQYAAVATVTNVSGHAEYKHNGTVGPIVPTSAPLLAIRGPGGKIVARRRSVEGQVGDPWIERSCTRIAESKGAVRVA